MGEEAGRQKAPFQIFEGFYASPWLKAMLRFPQLKLLFLVSFGIRETQKMKN